MKKITLSLIFLLPALGFSQAPVGKIQSYLAASASRLGLTQQDISDWIVESEASSESTKINNYYIKQRHNGTEIFGAVTNVWVKNNEVLNMGDRFVANAAQKVNATTPTLSVMDGLSRAVSLLEIPNAGPFEIIETISPKEFKISNGSSLSENQISAELVYQLTAENTLKLAWDYILIIPGFKHVWNVRIDAIDGKLLEKNDMVISCSFGDAANHALHDHSSAAFTQSFFKESKSLLDIQSGSYRVVPFNIESPIHGPRQLITSPHDVVASPYGWHDINGVAGNEFTITRGNNVLAVDDSNDNDLVDGVSPNGTASLNFDFPYNGTNTQPSTYLNASVTNLFYMNNIMHDIWYRYGFNEANANFQQKNYTGASNSFGGDAVNADAQDGSLANPPNINNANFFTPPNGQKPRMQMYLWNRAPSPLTIITPLDYAGPKDFIDNAFSPGHVNIPVTPASIESDLVLYNDGTPDVGQTDNADGCGPAVNAAAINGHIAVIRRSTAEASGGTPCAFIEKVKNAQNAGATAVIILNNVEGLIGMSGADATVTIPAIIMSLEDGQTLIAKMQAGTVHAKLQRGTDFVNADGDLDNGIIAHEYGHGISNRLTGGGNDTGCLFNAESMGEGWSDWFALVMQLKAGDTGANSRGIGRFAVSQSADGGGIRTAPFSNAFPYSTDMAINPVTLDFSNSDSENYRYDVGFVWTSVLWDLTWAYIEKYGFDANVYSGTGGNNKVMRLILDGMKLQPCNPGFIAGRNAIIAADQATTGGADYCMIWEVFARRGLGVNASSGSTFSSTDQVEDFTEPAAGANCTLAVDHFHSNDMMRVYPNPSNGEVTIHINQFSGKVNLTVSDINGRTVFNIANTDFNIEKTINLSHLQSGMYVLKVNGENLNYTQKILLN